MPLPPRFRPRPAWLLGRSLGPTSWSRVRPCSGQGIGRCARRSELEAVEHDARRLRHGRAHPRRCRPRGDRAARRSAPRRAPARRLRCRARSPSSRRAAASPRHWPAWENCAVSAGWRSRRHGHASRKRCAGAGQHGVVDGGVRPPPKLAVGFAVRPQQVARHDIGGWPIRSGQRWRLHAVLDRQHALLEQFALPAVRFLGGVWRDRAGLLGEGQVGIAGPIGRLHGQIAGQRRRDAEFLL